MKSFQLPDLNEEKSVLKTIRLKFNLLKKIEQLSKETNLSINRIINECIEYALNHLDERYLNVGKHKRIS